ncbi:YhdP family protein [Chitinibacteraceae bacterium HSL-7]
MSITALKDWVRRTLSAFLSFVRWHIRQLVRIGLVLLLVPVVLAAAWQILALPRISGASAELAHSLSGALGTPVQIGTIQGGWCRLQPCVEARDVRIGPDGLKVARMQATLGWTSLLAFEPRFSRITLDLPRLSIVRDSAGHWHAGGFLLSGAHDDTRSMDWLLRQGSLTLRIAHVQVDDRTQTVSPLGFDNTLLTFQRSFGRHKARLETTPPTAMGQRFSAEFDWRGNRWAQWRLWSGSAELTTERLDLQALTSRLPAKAMSGLLSGSLRVGFDGGRLTSVRYDGEAKAVVMQVSDRLVEVRDFSGTGDVSLSAGALKALTFNAATLVSATGAVCTNCSLSYDVSRDGYATLAASSIDLAGLAAWQSWLPGAEKLAGWSASGVLERVALRRSARGEWFGRVALRQGGLVWPKGRLGGLDLDAEVAGEHVQFRLKGKDAFLTLPSEFEQAIRLDRLSAQGEWARSKQSWLLTLSSVKAENADAELAMRGSYRHVPGTPGVIDLSGTVSRARAAAVVHYLPLHVGPHTREWLKMALIAGEARQGRFAVRGDLAHFPFANPAHGTFDISAEARGVTLAFAPGWPELSQIDGRLRFHGNAMDIQAERALTQGVAIGPTRVWIDEFHKHGTVLNVAGQAKGQTSAMLAYLGASPLKTHSPEFTHTLPVSGSAQLDLGLKVPLDHAHDTEVDGKVRIDNNQLAAGAHWPALSQVSADIRFDQHGVAAVNEGRYRLWGAQGHVVATRDQNALRLTATGQIDSDRAARLYAPTLAGRISGQSAIRVSALLGQQNQVEVNLPLERTQVALPSPLSKALGSAKPLRLTLNDSGGSVRYGGVLAANWRSGAGLSVALGETEPGDVPSAGVRLSGGWSVLDGDAVLPLLTELGGGTGTGAVEGALRFERMSMAGHMLSKAKLSFRKVADRLHLEVDASELAGQLTLALGRSADVRLARLTLPLPTTTGSAGASQRIDWAGLPDLHVQVDELKWRGRPLGALSANARAVAQGWNVPEFRLKNDEGALSGSLVWKAGDQAGQTQLSIKLDSSNIGNTLGRLGMEGAMERAPGVMEATLTWPGQPHEGSLAGLDGKVSLKLGEGRFNRIDPGAAKLLSLFSVQSVLRRLQLAQFSLDDLFAAGVTFSGIDGSFAIRRGLMNVDSLIIDSSSAKVMFSGQVNLPAQTQQLRLRIVPMVGDTVALAAAVVNPLAGLAAFALQRVLNDPLGHIVAFEYDVTGTWDDPHVKRTGQTAPVGPVAPR